MDLDEIFERIGEFGPRQRVYVAIIYLAQGLMALQMCFLVFAGATPGFECPGGGADRAATCRSFDAGTCPNLAYEVGWLTLTQEKDLICGQAYRMSSLQSLYMGGVLIGCLVFGLVCDSIGRSRTTLLCSAIIGLGGFAMGFAESLEAIAALRFVIGVGVAGHGIATYVLGSELVGGSWRTLYVIGSSASFAIGICGLSILAAQVDNWRSFAHLIAVVQAVIMLTYLYLPYSPRWLLSQGRHAEALAVLQDIGKGNGVPAKVLEGLDVKRTAGKEAGGEAVGVGVILRHWTLLKWTLIQIYSWFANSAVYYGLTMAAGGLSSDLFLSVALSGLVELPAYAVMSLLQGRVGRRTLVCGSMITGGLSCVLILLLDPASTATRTALALLGKMGISASFASIYLHTTELFPTPIRSGGLGICSTSARLGGILAPFISLIGISNPGREFAVFGLLGLSSGLLNLRLPETFGRPLPESVPDVLALEKDHRHNMKTKSA